MRQTRWYLVAALLGLTLAQPASAAEPETRGDPKTTYDQSENQAHSSKDAQDSEALSTSSQTSASSSSAPEGHWLIRQVKTSTGGRWTLYENGEVKQVEGL